MNKVLLEFYPNLRYDESNGDVLLYSDKEIEYNSLYNGVGIYKPKVSFLGLKGADSIEFINRISTNNVKGLETDQHIATIFTNEKGRIIDFTQFLNIQNELFLLGNGVYEEKLIFWINKYIITEDVSVNSYKNRYSVLEFYGSQVPSFLNLLADINESDLSEKNILKINIEGNYFNLFKVIIREGVNKYLIFFENQFEENLLTYIFENKSVFDVSFIGEGTYNIFRIEQGIPAPIHELNDMNNPHEVDLLDYVSFSKGCYIGQEVIARLDTYDKVQKKLVGLELNSNEFNLSTDNKFYFSDNEEAGFISSLVHSDISDKKVGLGFLKRKLLNELPEIFIKKDSNKYEIKIKELPFRK